MSEQFIRATKRDERWHKVGPDGRCLCHLHDISVFDAYDTAEGDHPPNRGGMPCHHCFPLLRPEFSLPHKPGALNTPEVKEHFDTRNAVTDLMRDAAHTRSDPADAMTPTRAARMLLDVSRTKGGQK